MTLMAVAMPIAPGQFDSWKAWLEELNSRRHDEFAASRRAAGVRERTFLQETPMGQLVIVTLEGDDPMASFATMMSAQDEFTEWFVAHANEAHGVDLTQAGAPSVTLVADSGG